MSHHDPAGPLLCVHSVVVRSDCRSVAAVSVMGGRAAYTDAYSRVWSLTRASIPTSHPPAHSLGKSALNLARVLALRCCCLPPSTLCRRRGIARWLLQHFLREVALQVPGGCAAAVGGASGGGGASDGGGGAVGGVCVPVDAVALLTKPSNAALYAACGFESLGPSDVVHGAGETVMHHTCCLSYPTTHTPHPLVLSPHTSLLPCLCLSVDVVTVESYRCCRVFV